MLIDFSSTSLLTESPINAKNDVSNEIKKLFKNNYEKKKLIYKFLDEFKKEKEVENFTSLLFRWGSSIQTLGENKYLVGTNSKGFWLLEFDDGTNKFIHINKIKGAKDVDVSDLISGNVGDKSSIQALGNNKYLVGTKTKGFWFLKFDNDKNKFSIVERIKGTQGVDVPKLTTDKRVGDSSSIQSLENNKYLVGTKTKGFWFLKFDDSTNKFIQVNKIKGAKDVDVLDLTTDIGVGWGSSIESLGNNKYLVGTYTKGFWLLKFNDNGLVVKVNKIQGTQDVDVLDLTADGDVGYTSSIQNLGENKYLIGTYRKGFWFLKFNNDGLVVQANRIQGKGGVDVLVLTVDGDVGWNSSIQTLGNNKYLVGTGTEGFWLLEFDNDGLVVKANEIQNSNSENVTDLTNGDVGYDSSIEFLGNNKYLVGTGTEGFWLLKFDDITNKFSIAKKIEGTKDVDVSDLTNDVVGKYSSIQDLKNNKYLVGTGTKGFWLLELDDAGLVVRANKIQDEDGVDVLELTTDKGVGNGSSIESLGKNKYLVGTGTKGFWLLEFDDGTNKFTIAKKIEGKDDVDVLVLTTDNKRVGKYSSIQALGKNKYLIGTKTKGFWFLKFNDGGLVVQANKIQGTQDVDVLKLTTDEGVGSHSSIQSLGNNKYLVGTGTEGFWLLKFNDDDDGLVVQANNIQGKGDVNVLDLTTDIWDVGWSSSIQDLGNNKYLVGTHNKGFWLLKFDDGTNKFSIAKRIEGTEGIDVLDLTADGDVGSYSSIQALGKNKYLVGTGTKGFWLLKFDNDGLVVKANRIQDSKSKNISDLTSGEVGADSSIQALGKNKYLVGTGTKGFWLLKFDNDGLVVQANRIQGNEKVSNDEFNDVYDEKIEEFNEKYKELKILSNFESDDKTFWKEFVMKTFVVDEENKELKIVDDYSFSNKEIWTKEKLEKFKEWLVEEKDNSGKWKLWFLTIIPIVPIVIFLFYKKIKK